MTDLLSCPFCGGAPEEHWPNSTTKHFIQCGGCGARTSINLASHGGSARDEWNRRVLVSALPGEAEVVRYIERCKELADDGDGGTYQWWSRLAEILASLQAMQARAEAAEKELKTQFNQHVDDLAKARGESEADKQSIADLTDRVKELEEALGECKEALLAAEDRDHRARFRANTPRGDAEVVHLRTTAIRRAHTTLKGGSNG